MDFYFVDRIGACHAGGRIELQPPKYDFQHPTIENLQTAPEIAGTLSASFPEGLSLHGQRYLLEKYVFNQGMVAVSPMIELATELIRRWQFPDRPSRMQSFFACETLDSARQFRAQFCQPFHRIFLVQAEKHFRADMNLLRIGPTGGSSLNLLQKYWRGEESRSPFWEILLPAPLQLGELVDPAS